jgi:hypothetical protein
VLVWSPHHNDVDLDTFEPVAPVHSRALDRHLAFERHAERGEERDSGCKVVDDDADVVQPLDRHVPSVSRGRARRSRADRWRELARHALLSGTGSLRAQGAAITVDLPQECFLRCP